MSLFGDSPTDNGPALGSSPPGQGGGGGGAGGAGGAGGLFDDEPASGRNSSSLFDDGSGASSPWDMPTPRKQQSRAELIRNLLPASDVPESYIETFDAVVREDGHEGQVTASGIAKLFAVARLDADAQARIMSLVAPGGSDVSLSRNEFNVVLALIGLAQEGDIISLDGVDERRKSESRPIYTHSPFAPSFSCWEGPHVRRECTICRLDCSYKTASVTYQLPRFSAALPALNQSHTRLEWKGTN